jgi:hypothetical protein
MGMLHKYCSCIAQLIPYGAFWQGYSSVFCYFPNDKFGIVLTSSADGVRFEDFVLYIAMHAARALGMKVDIPERTTTTNRLSPQEISELAALYLVCKLHNIASF